MKERITIPIDLAPGQSAQLQSDGRILVYNRGKKAFVIASESEFFAREAKRVGEVIRSERKFEEDEATRFNAFIEQANAIISAQNDKIAELNQNVRKLTQMVKDFIDLEENK